MNDDLPPASQSQTPPNPQHLLPQGHAGGPPPGECENRWKLALESSGDGVWDWNVATGDQTHSLQWKEMLGYSALEIGTGYDEFTSRVHPDDLAQAQAAASACLEGKVPDYAVDLRLRCKDGSWKWVLSRGKVVSRDAQGRPLRMIGTHTDINERKQTEAELRGLNEQLFDTTRMLQTTLTSISQGVLVIDREGCVSAFNPRVCELLDLPESLLAGRPTLNQVHRYQLDRGDFGPGATLVDPKDLEGPRQPRPDPPRGHPRNRVRGTLPAPRPAARAALDPLLRLLPSRRQSDTRTGRVLVGPGPQDRPGHAGNTTAGDVRYSDVFLLPTPDETPRHDQAGFDARASASIMTLPDRNTKEASPGGKQPGSAGLCPPVKLLADFGLGNEWGILKLDVAGYSSWIFRPAPGKSPPSSGSTLTKIHT